MLKNVTQKLTHFLQKKAEKSKKKNNEKIIFKKKQKIRPVESTKS